MIKIAVGCGARYYGDDWFHVDGGKQFPHVGTYDVSLSDWKDETVDLIYASHLLNYFDHSEVPGLLNTWRHKLKPGGVLRLAVPDFNAMSELYYDGKINLEDIRGPILGKWDLNGIKIYHRSIWDWSSLANALELVGFDNVRMYDWRETSHCDVDDHSQAFLNPKGDKKIGTLISLNVEAQNGFI